MQHAKLSTILLSTAFFLCVKSNVDLFSSMHEMEQLHQHELHVSNHIENHLQDIDSQLKAIEQFLAKNFEIHNYTEEDAESYVSHPLNTFSIIKRTSMEWPKLKEKLFGNKTQEKVSEFLGNMTIYNIGEKDLEGAMQGLLLLTYTYRLNISELARGKIRIPNAQAIEQNIPVGSFVEDSPLNAKDLELMGKLAYNLKHISTAIEALQEAEIQAKLEKNTEMAKEIHNVLSTIKRKHDEIVAKPHKDEAMRLFTKPFDKKLSKKKKYSKLKSMTRPAVNGTLFKRDNLSDRQLDEMFEATCRGDSLRSPEYDSHLKCRLIHYHDPYLLLGPFKFEELNLQPFVAIFRDFISDNEVENYIEETEGKMKRSQHSAKSGDGSDKQVSTNKRTSKQIWLTEFPDGLYQSSSESAFKVSVRIRQATMTNCFSAFGSEHYQVANYGIGGQYSRHYDAVGEGYLEPGFENEGTRVQTFMAYLSNVEAGGATAFPLLGLAVWPKKGDAITWYNIDRNGRQDKLTMHGGCPVIKGNYYCRLLCRAIFTVLIFSGTDSTKINRPGHNIRMY